ncbi:MFS general substrate transporter [Dipodascopsis tothii]|uniref:MFS general substrate transporter n=1 Tax=Dipodascopsis tothii TaxID=44089 RepID=UPI0034CD3F74
MDGADQTESTPESGSSFVQQDVEKSTAFMTTEQVTHAIESLAVEMGINQKKLMRKIDMRLVPTLCVLYLWAFLDRVNMSNANSFGLSTDLKLVGNQYNTALTMFFVPYIVCEIPSNMLMKRFKPHVWLSLCMFLFGLVTAMQGLVQNYSGLLATRFFLGVAEAGMFPGCFYLLAMWYRRVESQVRYSFFFASTSLAGAFAGLLASAIGKMQGMRGYNGWRWIFILEGVATAVLGLIFFFCIADFPEEAKFLDDNERKFVKIKLEMDVGKSQRSTTGSFKTVLSAFKDPKIFLAGFMYFGLIIPSYGYAYFATNIIHNFGYSSIKTQLYSVPPWAASFFISLIVAWFSDRMRHRYAFVVLMAVIGLIGEAILLTVQDRTSVRYGALFMVTGGMYSAMPIIVCWTTTNLCGHIKRATGTGWQVGFGNVGGIIATFAFLAKDAPKYTVGAALGIAFPAFSIIASTIYVLLLARDNRRKDKGIGLEKWDAMTDNERLDNLEMSPSYRFQY